MPGIIFEGFLEDDLGKDKSQDGRTHLGAFGGFYQHTGGRRGATVVVIEPWHLTGKRGQEPEQIQLED